MRICISTIVVAFVCSFSVPQDSNLTIQRANDETHEYVSYPKHSEADESNKILKREGYTTYYDANHRIPLWVSYKVTREWVEAERLFRSAPWSTDPELENNGPNTSDYQGSGYSRGHMAMQACLKGRSIQCEQEGYYYSNIVPQHMDFNGGIWLTLEEKVMAWADQFGEVWVVCGPVLGKDDPKLEERITVPLGFYKIIARETKEGMETCSFFFLHSSGNTDSLVAALTTVDTIESLTGLDFFAALNNSEELAMESHLGLGGFPLAAVRIAPRTPKQERGPPEQEETKERKQQTPTVIVYGTRTGAKYHRGTCRYLRKSKIPMSLEEAKRRYSPCSVCDPPR